MGYVAGVMYVCVCVCLIARSRGAIVAVQVGCGVGVSISISISISIGVVFFKRSTVSSRVQGARRTLHAAIAWSIPIPCGALGPPLKDPPINTTTYLESKALPRQRRL